MEPGLSLLELGLPESSIHAIIRGGALPRAVELNVYNNDGALGTIDLPQAPNSFYGYLPAPEQRPGYQIVVFSHDKSPESDFWLTQGTLPPPCHVMSKPNLSTTLLTVLAVIGPVEDPDGGGPDAGPAGADGPAYTTFSPAQDGVILNRVAALLEALGEDEYLSTTVPSEIASIVYVARNLHNVACHVCLPVGDARQLCSLKAPAPSPPPPPSQIPTTPPFQDNSTLQETLCRVVANPWVPPLPTPPPEAQKDGRRRYKKKRGSLSDSQAAIRDVMVPMAILDEPLREEVRDLLRGVVTRALHQAVAEPGSGLPPVPEMMIEVDEAKTRIPLQPLHTWYV